MVFAREDVCVFILQKKCESVLVFLHYRGIREGTVLGPGRVFDKGLIATESSFIIIEDNYVKCVAQEVV